MLLGLALYLVVAVLAGTPGAQFWLTLLLAAPFALFLIWQIASNLRSGSVAVGRMAIRRADSPSTYWLWIMWFGAMATLSACLCTYAAAHLIGA